MILAAPIIWSLFANIERNTGNPNIDYCWKLCLGTFMNVFKVSLRKFIAYCQRINLSLDSGICHTNTYISLFHYTWLIIIGTLSIYFLMLNVSALTCECDEVYWMKVEFVINSLLLGRKYLMQSVCERIFV